MKNRETILITGGAGAIGSNLANFLVNKGFRVIVLDDLSSGSKELLDKRVIFYKGSVTQNKWLLHIFNKYSPKRIAHLAALFANQNSVDHPKDDLNISGIGTLRLLEYCVKFEVSNFVFTSSSCVYGNSRGLITENTAKAVDFSTPYAISKRMAEEYCQYFYHTYGLNAVILRLFNNFGPGEYPGKYRNVIPNFVKLALNKKPLTILGTGNETRDFNFVDNTVSGIYKALFSTEHPGQIFNIASGTQTKIIYIALLINKLTNNKAGVLYLPRRKWDHVLQRNPSINKAKEFLGYIPVLNLEKQINKTIEWIKDNG
jgi:nucleoside-diphosphate-sugar epimerase